MLPIDPLLPEILASLRRHPNLAIEAAPGAGKTTRVPAALLQFPGEVLVLEPRRIAARMAARRVAHEIGECPGETVGYQVRFEEMAGVRTRLRFLTEGVFTRRMISDPELRGVSAVVLDEFHERHLETDLALALVRRLQKTTRPDLRIVVMSATLDTAPVSRFLGDCPALRSEGRMFDVATTYHGGDVAAAIESVLREPGHILVFLPGAPEIHRAARACDALARRHDLFIAPLYGDLPPSEQDLAVEPSARRKVVLATNIAESSITIDGVRIVIDSGLARVASDSPWTGLPSLETKRISKASARQRAGRAGRTAPGNVIRLYTAEDFHRRSEYDAPEIARRELSQMCLQLETMGVRDPLLLEWLDPPPAPALEAAESLLDRLRARGPAAREMARLPVHPRLARMLLDAEAAQAGEHACRIAALLSSGQRVKTLDDEPDARTRLVFSQLRRFVKPGKGNNDSAAAKALLAAFPDRVRSTGPGEFVVAIDIEDRSPTPAIRLACPIETGWLIDLFPDRMTDRTGVEWNRQAARVESVSALLYESLVIDESRGGPVDDEAAARLLASKAIEAGIDRFVDTKAVDEFFARLEFASEHSEIERLAPTDLAGAFTSLCYGLRSFAELEKISPRVLLLLEEKLDRNLLEQIAPSRLRLPSGRNAAIHYERGKPPWVASRLQDFFGMTESPRIARDAVPLVVHLLAPNQRAVQTTTDLAGFWQRLYPQLRRELGRRYPRHAWPERPV